MTTQALSSERPLDAILACRVQGSRLYAKPLQRLEYGGVTILEYLCACLEQVPTIRKIVLAIAEGVENTPFIEFAKKKNYPFVIGNERDVLHRIITAARQENTSDVLRITSECPFVLYEYIPDLYEKFLTGSFDYATIQDAPEGTYFELIRRQALEISHEKGNERNRSELVTSYINQHQNEFKILLDQPPPSLRRPEVRLTVDYAEDLIFCQKVFRHLYKPGSFIKVSDIVTFWDQHPDLRKPLETIGVDYGVGRLSWT